MPAADSLEQLCTEAWPLARMWFSAQRAKMLPQDKSLAFCYDVLNKVSRSFAVVIQQLPFELRDSVCIFYLVLRALDTVEDDMAISVEVKLPILRTFYQRIFQRGWSICCGEKEYAKLMENYPLVTDAYLTLPILHQKVIADIAKRMGEGMSEFIERNVLTIQDYDLYCHYVAGLVGIGLSQLFVASGLESSDLAETEELSNGMGLFLQKTNIIRDYLEDILEEPAPRMFWPKEIWALYAKDLADFKDSAKSIKAVQALNHMVTDALRHAPASLTYLSKLQNREIFRFCAIPQVMAIATLAEIYNNHKVYTGVVKVRRGVVARYMMGLNDLPDLHRAFAHFAGIIIERCNTVAAEDPNASITSARAGAILNCSTQALTNLGEPLIASTSRVALIVRSLILLMLMGATVRFYSTLEGGLWQSLMHIFITFPTFLVAALFVYSSSLRV